MIKSLLIKFIDLSFKFTMKIHLFILEIKDRMIIMKYGTPNVLTAEQSVDKIIKNKASVARFGDGEFKLIYNVADLKFQKRNKLLSKRLKEVITSNINNLYIGIPKIFTSKDLIYRNNESRIFWKNHLLRYRAKWYKLLDFKYTYINASFTRNYIGIKNKNNIIEYFNKVKKIWGNRDIILIEGKFSRVGVGNDLLNNTRSISRIIAPAENAFDYYEQILNSILEYPKDFLILIALGPTATILAKDLHCIGYQTIDIGHIDIEYEWALKKAQTKIPISNKYTIEADSPILNDNFTDKEYEVQIKKVIQ